MPAKDVVYTANAVPDEYIITYELNGGTVVGNPNKFTADTTSFTRLLLMFHLFLLLLFVYLVL